MCGCEADLWFVLQVTPRHEKKVDTLLDRRGFVHFLPTCEIRSKWSDRIKRIEQPLFPGYVFCKGHKVLPEVVRNTAGIIRIVNFGRGAQPIQEEEMRALRQVVESKRDVQRCPYLNVGQMVQIVTGPLSGITGIVTGLKKRERLIISVSLIAKSISVEIDQSEITLLDCAAA